MDCFFHNDIKLEESPLMQKEFLLTPEEAENFIRSRRSVRNFKKQQVENEVIDKLLNVVRYAPSGSNSQLVKWYVMNSKEKIHELSGIVVDMMRHLLDNKDTFAENYGLDKLVEAWDKGYDAISRGATALIFAYTPTNYNIGIIDSTIAMTHLDILAPSFGLGTCWGGFFMFALARWQPLRDALNIYEGYTCHSAMMLGYPRYQFSRMPSRKPANIIWSN